MARRMGRGRARLRPRRAVAPILFDCIRLHSTAIAPKAPVTSPPLCASVSLRLCVSSAFAPRRRQNSSSTSSPPPWTTVEQETLVLTPGPKRNGPIASVPATSSSGCLCITACGAVSSNWV